MDCSDVAESQAADRSPNQTSKVAVRMIDSLLIERGSSLSLRVSVNAISCVAPTGAGAKMGFAAREVLTMVDFPKRTTFVVQDAEAAARFYCEVFGMTTWYDNELDVDGRFPPCAPDGATARLVIVKANDPKIGMLGFLSYVQHQPDHQADFVSREKLRLGDTVLVFEVENLNETYRRAADSGARIVTKPARWSVPGPDGGTLELYSMSMFDSQGIYMEVGQKRAA